MHCSLTTLPKSQGEEEVKKAVMPLSCSSNLLKGHWTTCMSSCGLLLHAEWLLPNAQSSLHTFRLLEPGNVGYYWLPAEWGNVTSFTALHNLDLSSAQSDLPPGDEHAISWQGAQCALPIKALLQASSVWTACFSILCKDPLLSRMALTHDGCNRLEEAVCYCLS